MGSCLNHSKQPKGPIKINLVDQTGPRRMSSRHTPMKRSTTRKSYKSLVSSQYHMNDEEITNVYDFIKKLGKGYHGSVKLAVLKTDPYKYYAVKSIDKIKLTPDQLANLSKEIEILAKLDHPNIITYYETYNDQSNLHIVTEYCEGGELFDRLAQKQRFSESEAAVIFYKLVSAINHCHSKGIVHRDLKLENILLVDKSHLSDVKIIDFGLSRKIGDQIMTSVVGTPYYVAPEVISGCYDKMCDIWGLGIILYMMLLGRYPFDHENRSKLFYLIKFKSLKFDCCLSEEARNLLGSLLAKEPHKRPSAHKILESQWFYKNFKIEKLIDMDIIPRLHNFRKPKQFIKLIIKLIISEISSDEIERLKMSFHVMEDKTGSVDLTKFESNNEETSVMVDLKSQSNLSAIKMHSTENMSKFNYSSFLAALISSKDFLNETLLRKIFNRLDVDNTNMITVKGFQQTLKRTGKIKSIKEVEGIFAEVGVPPSSNITFEEFGGIIKNNLRQLN